MNELPALPDDSPERANALTSLRNCGSAHRIGTPVEIELSS